MNDGTTRTVGTSGADLYRRIFYHHHPIVANKIPGQGNRILYFCNRSGGQKTRKLGRDWEISMAFDRDYQIT